MLPSDDIIPSPLSISAALFLLLLGLLGAGLLIQMAIQAFPHRRQLWYMVRNRMASLPAARLPIGPLLAVLGLGAFLGIARAAGTRPLLDRLPTGADLVASTLFQIGTMALAVAACLYLSQAGWRNLLGTTPRNTAHQAIATGLRGGVMMLVPVWLLAGLGSLAVRRLHWPELQQETLQWLVNGQLGDFSRFWLIAVAVVVAPVAEELVFRGLLLPHLAQQGTRVGRGLLLASLLFAALHLHAPGLLPLFGVALACSAGFLATGNLLTPVVMHAVFNAISLLVLFAAQ
jgi:membrane protease YdiL (CAAX protease family)